MPEHLFVRFGGEGQDATDKNAMLQRIRAHDWMQSPLGPIENWPNELKSAVRLILLSSSAMAVLAGREGIVIQNDAVVSMLGERFSLALGQAVAEVLPVAGDFFRHAIAECYDGKGVSFRDQPVKLKRNGLLETAWFSIGLTPIADIDGNIYGVLVVASETTERMRAHDALERSQQRMELALDAGGIVATWELDVRNARVNNLQNVFQGMSGIYQTHEDRFKSTNKLVASVHPDDHDRVLSDLNHAIGAGTEYRCRYRAVTSEGGLRWLIISGRPVRNEQGRIIQYAGIVSDITEQVETATALEQSNLRFDILAESIPQIIWSTDASGQHDYFNKRWSEFTGLKPEDIDVNMWHELVHPEDRARVAEAWQECLMTGKNYDIDYRFRYKDGSYRWLWVVALPLKDREGKIVRWYGTSSDIDAPKQLEEQRELVSHELDHRIKNLFALVNGLVSLSARDLPEHMPLADRIRSRLDALHRAHGLIRSNSSRKTIALKDLLGQLLAPYHADKDGAIKITGEDFELDAGSTTSIALIFHELITNAAKYGALSRSDGDLSVNLEKDDKHQIIEWVEKVDQQEISVSEEGFGSRLLKTIVKSQLQGRIVQNLLPEGLAIRLEIPHSAFLSSDG